MNPAADLAFTARDLGGVLGKSIRQVQRRAKREGWPRIKESCPGGSRYRYLLGGLPVDVAVKALRWRAAEAAGPAPGWEPVFEYDADALWAEAARCPAKHREKGESRARILREVETLIQGEGLSWIKAATRVAAGHGLSYSAVRSWQYGRRVNGVERRGARDYAPQDRAAALVPRHAKSGGPRKRFPEEARRVFNRIYQDSRKPTVADSYRRTCEYAEAAGLDMDSMPSLRTVQAWLRKDTPGDVLDTCARGGAICCEEGPQAAD